MLATRISEIFEQIPHGDADTVGRAQLRAVDAGDVGDAGDAGYVALALDNPGLFHAAFFVPSDLESSSATGRVGPGSRSPLDLLTATLDQLVVSGAMPPKQRP